VTEEFEGQDLHGADFWGVDLSESRFRDVDLTGVTISHARVVDVDIDGFVENVTINGVDVTAYVNERDPWFPLRAQLRPSDAEGMRATHAALQREWDATIAGAGQRWDTQVDGEWSLVQTLRHLVFAMDKWFTVPVLGDDTFHPIGMPNTGSIDFGWPGLDLDASPSFDEVVAVRRTRHDRLRDYLESVTDADLAIDVEVLENGTTPVRECVHVVFEEEFEHLRYARRDLARLR
jgi:hypothetical protein